MHPGRLKDDKAFLLETGIRFEDEEALLTTYDVPAMRGRLDAHIAAGAGPILKAPPAMSRILTLVGVSVIVAGSIIAGLVAGDSPAGDRAEVANSVRARTNTIVAEEKGHEPAPLTTIDETAREDEDEPRRAEPIRVEPQPVPATEEVEPRQTAPVEPGAAVTIHKRPSKPKKKTKTPRPRRPELMKEVTIVAPAAPSPLVVEPKDEPIEEETAPADDRSTLAEQLALYERGRKALRGGKLEAAVQAFKTYRKRFPKGELWQESSLSMLEALVRRGRHGATIRLARSLLARGSLRHRRGEVLRVKGEAEAKLGRCDAAEKTFAKALKSARSGLTAESILGALRHCRRVRGEEQP